MPNDHVNEFKGALGAVIGVAAPSLQFLSPFLQILSGIGGVILVVLSIRYKIIQIRNEKNK